MQPPAKVYLFHVKEKGVVKSPYLQIGRFSHNECGPCGPETLSGVVVLSRIRFENIEDTPARERITVAVHEAATGPRIFKALPLFQPAELGLTGGQSCVGCKELQGLVQPIRFNLDIEVQQYENLARSRCYGSIIGSTVPPISVKRDNSGFREILPNVA
jgi:hypothetical protein